jgi:hypothetical protein
MVDCEYLARMFELDEIFFVDLIDSTNGMPVHRLVRHG